MTASAADGLKQRKRHRKEERNERTGWGLRVWETSLKDRLPEEAAYLFTVFLLIPVEEATFVAAMSAKQ